MLAPISFARSDRRFLAVAISLLMLLAACLPGASALAAANAGGVLVVHANAPNECSGDVSNYCTCLQLTNCENALTRHDGGITRVWWVLAAFPASSSPRLLGATFGVLYPPAVLLVGSGHCANFELADSNWPASGSGTALTFDSPKTGLLTPLYWFAGYNYYGVPATFEPTTHPTQGAYFADDSVPTQLDQIVDFGELGFLRDGYLPCPSGLILGGCCLPIGDCVVVTQHGCENLQGAYLGDGEDCDPNPCGGRGACCRSDGVCRFVYGDECVAEHGIFLGPGIECVPNPCSPWVRVCCLPDGSCSLLTEDECTSADGAWHSDAEACAGYPCPDPEGACCRPDGLCLTRTRASCESRDYEYLGDGIPCTPNPCPVPPSGGCCLERGGCIVTDQWTCERGPNDGQYLGDGTTCNPDPCPAGGACCHSVGVPCRVLTLAACLADGGTYLGDGTDCTPAPCYATPSACCFPSGQCQVLSGPDCVLAGGTPMGEGVPCTPNPCPQPPVGACCASDGTCFLANQDQCEGVGGNYQGDGSSCNPNPCQTTPIQKESWGRIKHRYR